MDIFYFWIMLITALHDSGQKTAQSPLADQQMNLAIYYGTNLIDRCFTWMCFSDLGLLYRYPEA